MEDVTDSVIAVANVPANNEFVWDSLRKKLILFIDDIPYSFIDLNSYENNNPSEVTNSAVKILNGEGVVI